MQFLEVISVNIWQILISLLNLVILFFILKRFLFKPVQGMLAKRQEELDKKYDDAEQARSLANSDREFWNEKMKSAKKEGESIIQKAIDDAKNLSSRLIFDANTKADGIIKEAKAQAQLELKKAEKEIKQQIVDTSVILADKMLEREINIEDHQTLINSFIEGLGDDNGSDQNR